MFPTSIPSFPTINSSHTLATAGHVSITNSVNSEVVALATKVGTGSSVAANGQVLRATGAGTSEWGGVVMATHIVPFTSSDILNKVSNPTGSGLLVFGTSPTISGATLSGSPTIITPTIASFANANHDHSNAAGGGVLTHTALPLGVIVQQVQEDFSAHATGTADIPYDNTPPQSNEGTEFMTIDFTPKSATNILVVEASASLSNTVVTTIIGALFKDSEADARGGDLQYSATADGSYRLAPSFKMTAGATAAMTFKFRAGEQTGTGGTLNFNGATGVSLLSAITKSWMRVTEYKAS